MIPRVWWLFPLLLAGCFLTRSRAPAPAPGSGAASAEYDPTRPYPLGDPGLAADGESSAPMVRMPYAPMPGGDPAVAELRARVEGDLAAARVDLRKTRVFYRLQDLSGDGVPEGVALVWAPGWSDSGGGTLLVYRGTGRGYAAAGRTRMVRLPVFAGASRSSGWLDLLVPTGGHGLPGGLVALQFDGRSYPDTASEMDMLPEIPQGLLRLLP